jgi:hypothetical protein
MALRAARLMCGKKLCVACRRISSASGIFSSAKATAAPHRCGDLPIAKISHQDRCSSVAFKKGIERVEPHFPRAV